MAATFAIIGLFPFAGFFSKDEILWKTWASGHHFLWFIGFMAAGLTAFYMFRLVALTFFGENRADEETKHHIHESPKVMLIPLVILAVLSVVGGWVGIPEGLWGSDTFHHWLAPVFSNGAAGHEAAGAEVGHAVIPVVSEMAAASSEHAGGHASHIMERVFAVISLVWAILWGYLGFYLYTKRPDIIDRIKSTANGLIHRLLENKYYVDEIYQAVFVTNLLRLTRACKIFDNYAIDGMVNGTGFLTRILSFVTGLFDNAFIDGMVNAVANVVTDFGQKLRAIQAGQIQGYLYFLFSVTVVFICLRLLF